MSFVVTLSGSPSARSRSAGLLGVAARVLRANGVRVSAYSLQDFPAEALIAANHRDPQVQRLNDDLAQADGVILATPIYKAAYSGGTKLLLDLLTERALERAVVLPLATGGSLAHMLAIDYAIRPVLAALSARHVVSGVYATDRDLAWADSDLDLTADIQARLQRSLTQFVSYLPAASSAALDFSVLTPVLASRPQVSSIPGVQHVLA